jgi:starch phosphorylase
VDLPDRIRRLDELAHDLWWSWTPVARRVFRTLDYPLWRLTAHNPVRMLQLISLPTLEAMVADTAWLAKYDRAIAMLDASRSSQSTWFSDACPGLSGRSIAYFSAEFALHQSLPIYAGGLGVLAGDHCKEASDLGLPLIGVGFMYPQGYFHHVISPDGWQEERYERLNWEDAPIEPALTPDEKPCVTAVPLGCRTVVAAGGRVRARRAQPLPKPKPGE